MKSWVNDYKNKLRTPEQVAAVVKSGHTVYTSGNAATPSAMIKALTDRRDELHDVKLAHVLLIGKELILAKDKAFRHLSFFVGDADRDAVNRGEADYIPIFLHKIPALFADGKMPIDVAFIQTSPPDNNGFLSLGVEVMASKAAARHAGMVVVQVNERMPRTHGDSFIHISEVDHVVELTHELPELTAQPANHAAEAIGKFVSDLIRDGDTLQLGIGAIPDSALAHMKDKRDIGVHTEMISDGIMNAVENGTINCRRKNFHAGSLVATFALGTRRLYEYIDDNPLFHFHPVDFTNDPFIAGENDNLVTINSAIEIDLTGQVCADSIGPYIYSGFGGQVDFVRAAARSKGGKAIIAMPSTAKGGTISRIVPMLKQGSGVVTTRADVNYVVTEHGMANLRGMSLRDRAAALIAIAEPGFRPYLTEEAKRLNWLS